MATQKLAYSYVHGASATPLLGETIGVNFDRTVARWPEHEALIVCHQRVRWNYRELQERVDALAAGLLALGLQPGERVGIWSLNNWEWIVTQFATAKAGLILVNVNPAYRVAELEYALSVTGCTALITADRFKTSDYLGMLAELLPELASSDPGRLSAARASELRTVIRLGDERTPGMLNFGDVACMGGDAERARLVELARFTEEDRLCIPVPMYHCFGMVLGALTCTTHGATMVLPSEWFDPRAELEAVEAERCTAIHGVPTMFIAELDDPELERFDLSSLRTGIMAGAPCPEELMRRVISELHVPEITIAYGMTETGPVSFQTSPDDTLERRVTTVGRVLPHVEVKIVDEEGRVVPVGETGELLTRGYLVMPRYWGDAERTAEAIDEARWIRSGDLATLDEDGYCRIVGRSKDMVIRGGENIYPREIEEFLFQHPKVDDAQVIGVPDPRLGEELCAWIRLREGESATEDEIRDFCRGQIAHFKIPRYIKFVDEFPMTVTGKVQKFLMREQTIEELGLDQVG
jgi:fatty-acyl-CoA synthase